MIGAPEIFTIFFVTLGPLKVLGPFAQRTQGLDDASVRRIAVWAFVIATIAIVVGSYIGAALAANWRVSIASLSIAAGIIFLLVAVMVLNLLAMLFARKILVGATMIVLQIVGAVLGVLQLGLAVEFIVRGLQLLGALPG